MRLKIIVIYNLQVTKMKSLNKKIFKKIAKNINVCIHYVNNNSYLSFLDKSKLLV